MALEFAKELLGDAYTGELEEKLEEQEDDRRKNQKKDNEDEEVLTGLLEGTLQTKLSVSLKGWTRSR